MATYDKRLGVSMFRPAEMVLHTDSEFQTISHETKHRFDINRRHEARCGF